MVNSLKCKIDLLIVFVVIVISEDTVLFGTNSNSLYVYVRYAIYLLLYVALLRRNNSFVVILPICDSMPLFLLFLYVELW